VEKVDEQTVHLPGVFQQALFRPLSVAVARGDKLARDRGPGHTRGYATSPVVGEVIVVDFRRPVLRNESRFFCEQN